MLIRFTEAFGQVMGTDSSTGNMTMEISNDILERYSTLFLFGTFSLKVIHFPWHGCHLGGQNGKFKACKNQIIVAKIFPNAIHVLPGICNK